MLIHNLNVTWIYKEHKICLTVQLESRIYEFFLEILSVISKSFTVIMFSW
jgi:hypothetical protein